MVREKVEEGEREGGREGEREVRGQETAVRGQERVDG